jgi:hypothetical protein
VVERIVLRVLDHSERVQVEIFWVGGCLTRNVVCRPVQRAEQLSYYAQVCAEIRLGAQEGETVLQTVARLNALEWRSPRGGAWGKQAVRELTCQLGLRRKRTRRAYGGLDGREGPWGITPLAREIGMPAGTLLAWIKNGEVAAERLESGRLVIQADTALIEQLRQRRQKSLSAVSWEHWQASLKEQR